MRKAPCVRGHSIAVFPKQRVIVVAGEDRRLHLYLLIEGSFMRTVGAPAGASHRGDGKFSWSVGGLCASTHGTLLVADADANRVWELSMDGDGAVELIRAIGEDVLVAPACVDGNDVYLAVSEAAHRVCVLTWPTGDVVAHFGTPGPGDGQLTRPRGLRLLRNGSGIVVADNGNHRVCLFMLDGTFFKAIDGFHLPRDVIGRQLE